MDPAVSNIYGIWLFPILLYFPLAVILDRKLYKVTRNPYLGGTIFALIMTIIAVTNTLQSIALIVGRFSQNHYKFEELTKILSVQSRKFCQISSTFLVKNTSPIPKNF